MKNITPKNLLKILKEREDVYCHVSTRIYKDNFFTPRIPDDLETYSQKENDNIDRVCVSKTLEGAFQAIPQGGTQLWNWYEDNGLYFRVFIIDTLKLGIKKENIYSPSYLVSNNYVYDAERTGEHWILEPFEVPYEYSFLVKLKKWKCIEVKNWVYDVESVDIFTEFIDKNEIIEIDLDYTDEKLGCNFDLMKEKTHLKENYLKFNPDIEFLDKESDDKIIFKSKKDQSIKELMEFDSNYKATTYGPYAFR